MIEAINNCSINFKKKERMKKLSFLVPLMAMLLMWTGCTEEEQEQLKPDVLLGEVTFNEDNTKAYVSVKPSETSMAWYWKNVEKDGEDVEYTKVSGNDSCKLEIPVSPATTYVFSVYSENVTGISEVKTKEFTTNESQNVETEEFSMNIKNVSPYTLDVDVVKGSSCEKYTIAMLPLTSYDEEQFVESSITSFNPNTSYPLQPYNWSDKDATFNEQNLYKGTLSTSDENNGIKVVPGEKYYIAAYLLDKEGNGSVVKEEVEIPAATVDFVTAGLDVTIDIKDEDITNTSVKATFTAPSGCKKILVTVIPNTDTYDELNTDEEKNAFIATIGNGVNVRPYTGTFSYQFKTILDYGVEYMVCAIPFNEEGKMGNIACKRFSTKRPELVGEGRIEAATVAIDDEGYIVVTMQPTENVETVRVYYATERDYNNVKDEMDMVMGDDISEFMRNDYTVDEVESGIKLFINHPGDNYYIIASTIDTNGKISQPQNVVTLSGSSTEYIVTTAPEEETVSFDGTGEATLALMNEIASQDGLVSGSLKVSKGEGAVKVFRVLIQDGNPDGINELMSETFENYPNEINGAVKELDFDENGEYVEEFNDQYSSVGFSSGFMFIVVTADNNDKLKINSYYYGGTGTVVNN